MTRIAISLPFIAALRKAHSPFTDMVPLSLASLANYNRWGA
jgi:hypothetical protein